MIEKTVLDYLNSVLDVDVVMEIKPNPPKTYVVVKKVGSSFDNRLDTATIAIKSYAETKYKAAELNERVKAAIENMIQLNGISKCYLNSDYDDTDVETKTYRYQALYVITYLREV